MSPKDTKLPAKLPATDDADVKTMRKELVALREVTDSQVRQIAELRKTIEDWRAANDKLRTQHDAYQQAVKDMNRNPEPFFNPFAMLGGPRSGRF